MKVGPEISSTATTPPSTAPELGIEMWLDNWVAYTGTAAQLQAEGLIPDGFAWPKAIVHRRWEAGDFGYWLRRTRPEGYKGPPRSWFEVDNWLLCVSVTGHDYNWRTRRDLERKAEALRAEYHRHTDAGAREWEASWRCYRQAAADKRFQAFKALVPGLVPPKRGRKPRAAQ